MAGLVYEVAREYDPIDIEVVPGITAACGGAAEHAGKRAVLLTFFGK